MDRLIVQIPFEGFYESKYSGAIDHCQEMDVDHNVEQDEEKFPEELRIDSNTYHEIFLNCASYSEMYHEIARDYVDAYNRIVGEQIGIDLGLEFEAMKSPREYNFETDRVFAYISVETVEKLFAMSAANGHVILAQVIEKRHTSYDGFRSFYRNTLDTWLAKPVTDWDHNELSTLLRAVHHIAPDYDEDWNWSVYYAVTDDSCFETWSKFVDWNKFDEEVKEARADLESEFRELDPDYVPPLARCEFTLDLFKGR